MPALTSSTFQVEVFLSASDIPSPVMEALQGRAVDANCILPSIIKALEGNAPSVAGQDSKQFWIVCSSGRDVELVLSCTNNVIDTYPIFIVSLRQLSDGYLRPRIYEMVQKFLTVSPAARVFSIFAPHDVAQIFTQTWYEVTGIKSYPEPYYAAKLSYCTKDTFNNRSLTYNPAWELRPAEAADLPRVADLCRQFASTSEPFTLDEEEAYTEAEYLILSGQVWVHTVSDGRFTDIASIVAFTRNSETNATITKVYTNPDMRGMSQGKKSVALFVAHDNIAASKVYHNVGFVGLAGPSHSGSVAPSWTEVGFDESKVVLGHW
ncbi:hypothetical protein V5O48_011687 [Marasmius crinis-equi]|uniref:N-acetyltransferase domain-containing protein n=1 Tax=Marasmius crinis-equi TaxID=585013 RepID=A0ABR3F527_9AGAR